MDTLTVDRRRLPTASVGDSVVVEVRALVTKIETEVIDATGFDPKGMKTYLPGETTMELLVMGLEER